MLALNAENRRLQSENHRLRMALGCAKPENWRYVGKLEIGLTQTDNFNKEKRDFKVPVLFFMKASGERKIKIVNEDKAVRSYVETLNSHGLAALAWVEGGSFPKDFIPEEDTLGPMLSRMIDAKLTGGSHE